MAPSLPAHGSPRQYTAVHGRLGRGQPRRTPQPAAVQGAGCRMQYQTPKPTARCVHVSMRIGTGLVTGAGAHGVIFHPLSWTWPTPPARQCCAAPRFLNANYATGNPPGWNLHSRSTHQAVMHAARFGNSAASLEQGPQGRPLCFIQPCCTSNLPAGLANYLESTEIARRHLQTVSEPAASAWIGSEPVQKGKPAELSKATEYMVLYCLGALQAVRSSRLLAPQNGQP